MACSNHLVNSDSAEQMTDTLMYLFEYFFYISRTYIIYEIEVILDICGYTYYMYISLLTLDMQYTIDAVHVAGSSIDNNLNGEIIANFCKSVQKFVNIRIV